MSERKPMQIAINILEFHLRIREYELSLYKKESDIKLLKLEIEDIKRALAQLEE